MLPNRLKLIVSLCLRRPWLVILFLEILWIFLCWLLQLYFRGTVLQLLPSSVPEAMELECCCFPIYTHSICSRCLHSCPGFSESTFAQLLLLPIPFSLRLVVELPYGWNHVSPLKRIQYHHPAAAQATALCVDSLLFHRSKHVGEHMDMDSKK